MAATFWNGIVRNGRVELELPLNWPEGTQVIVMPNASETVAAIESAERARIAARTPSDADLELIAVSPPREWLEEEQCS